jgi:hypothetical protein
MEKYLTGRKIHLALAQVQNDEYWKFYNQIRCENNSTLILDNGTYEGRLDIGLFEDRIAQMKPEVVVLPDIYCGDWDRNLHLGLGYLDITKATLCEFMFVPQAKPSDIQGFMKALDVAARNPRITWIALPRCLATDITHNPLARVFMAEYVRKEHPNMKIHALGMVDGNPYELPFLAEHGVYSYDSSAPVWRGICGHNLQSEWPGIEIQFDWVGDDIELELATSNLKEVDRACEYGIYLGKRAALQESVGQDSESSGAKPHFN